MNRRDFLKLSGAAVVASQLPDISEAKAESLLMKPGAPVARRRVIFLAEHDPDEIVSVTLGPPPVGTVVAGEFEHGGLRTYTVVENLDVKVINHVVSYWDTHHYNRKAGVVYWGYVAIVEGTTSGCHTGEIRCILTPNTGYSVVCENWRVERYGEDPDRPVLALDALEPELCQRAVKWMSVRTV